MDNLDNLRDNYKDRHKKSNGVSYSKKFHYKIKKITPEISINKTNININEINEINNRYKINNDTIKYSLNKNKRWNIVNELKTNMKQYSLDDHDIRLYETRHRCNNLNNDCISVHKSKGKNIKIKSTYANTQSILKTNQFNANSKKKLDNDKHIIIELDDEDQADQDYIQYDVKYAPNNDVLKYHKFNNETDKVVNKRFKNVLGDEKYLKIDDLFDINNEFIDNNDTMSITSKTDAPSIVSLEELINLYAIKILNKRKSYKRIQKSNTNDTKINNLIYIDTYNLNTNRNDQTDQLFNFDINISHLVGIDLNISNLGDYNKLKEQFGCNYFEALDTWPRIIVIDMIEDLYKLNSKLKFYDIKCWFICKQLKNKNKFNINIKINIDNIDFKTIDTSIDYTINYLYEKLIKLICDLPIDVFKLKTIDNKNVINNKNKFNHKLNEDLPNLTRINLCKNIDELKNELFDQIDQKNDDDQNLLIDYVVIDNESKIELLEQDYCLCSICFDQIQIDECTILKSCSHSICNLCMSYYINSKIRNSFNNAGKLFCPACDTELDMALIVYFASNVNLLDNFIKLSIERVLFVINNYKWCQSPYCNKIIKVDLTSTPYGIITCECGYKICLKCNMPPHFPAKCSQIAKYYNELKVKNDFAIMPTELYVAVGRKCPECYVFMEKISGCNSMFCTICKTQFCWNCGNKWAKHLELTNGQHNCIEKSDKNKLITVEFKRTSRPLKIPTEKKDYYENSIYHRRLRLNIESKKRTTNINRLINSIKHTELCNSTNEQKLGLHDQCKIILVKTDQIRQMLQKIVPFISELHFVCEHAYLLLKDENYECEIRNSLKNIIRNMEFITEQMDYIMENSSGLKAVEDLMKFMDKGLNCLQKLNSLKLNED